MTRLFQISRYTNKSVSCQTVKADDLEAAKVIIFGWLRGPSTCGERYLEHDALYTIRKILGNGSVSEVLWRDIAQVYSTELTSEGNPILIAGFESGNNQEQLILF